MLHFFRRHKGWGLFFIALVILSFVYFLSPLQDQGFGRAPVGFYGSIDGRPITRGEHVAAQREAALDFLLRQGRWPGDDAISRQMGWDGERATLERVFLIHQLGRLGVRVTDEEIAARIVKLPFLQDERTQKFNPGAYDAFVNGTLRPQGLSREDFERFVAHDTGVERLVALHGLSGRLVTPREGEARYREDHEQLAAQLVVFDSSNYLAQVSLNPTNVAQYYTNHLAEYRRPEMLQVRYVLFPASNHLAAADERLTGATNLDAILDAEYQRRGAETFRDEAGQLKTPEAARTGLRDEYRRTLAVELARTNANAFANELYRQELKADSLANLAAARALEVGVTAPFDPRRGPLDLRVPPTFSRAAAALNPDEPFSTPIVAEDGVYLIAYDQRFPSEIQPLEAVRAGVIEGLKTFESRELARQAGEEFARAVTNALGQGRTFDAACAEAHVQPAVLPPFSRATRTLPELGPRLTLNEVLNVTEDLPAGHATGFVPTRDGGFVLYLQSRTPVSDAEIKTQLPAYLASLRRQGALNAFQEWARRQMTADRVSGRPRTGDEAAPTAPSAAN